MSQVTQDLKSDLKKGLSDLEALRDEIRLQLHLAGMDAKKQWADLEKELNAAEEEVTRSATQATRDALDHTITKLKKFRASLQ
jgi:hypothetical protein